MENFCSKIIGAKMTGQTTPVVIVENVSFIYIRHKNLYLVAATPRNPNALLLLEYLFQKIKIIKAYIGEKFTDEKIRANFTLIYELMDETMDYGYPQNCTVDVLKLYINQGDVRKNLQALQTGASLTSQITGAIDWRRDGIRYRSNEVYIDVQETVSLLMNVAGAVLRAEINGKVMMKTQLTGMPECKFGLNDKLIMEKEGGAAASAVGELGTGVEIDDCTFHRCVRLGKFDAERTITFIPPDGEFELMRYRVTAPSQPFRLLPNITEQGRTKLVANLKIVSDFSEEYSAKSVTIKIPMPTTAATAKITVDRGRAKYEPGERAIIWKISGFQGKTECGLNAIIDLLPDTKDKVWVRPPISVDFHIPMYSGSGVQVRFLKVYEKSSYQTQRWVKYTTKSGEYQMRI
jgi:AP-2 complex subunit mu-1